MTADALWEIKSSQFCRDEGGRATVIEGLRHRGAGAKIQGLWSRTERRAKTMERKESEEVGSVKEVGITVQGGRSKEGVVSIGGIRRRVN